KDSGWSLDASDCNDADRLLPRVFYRDADGDGFGNPSIATSPSCSAPAGYVITNSDCNDSSAAVSPWAKELINGIDDNCNGRVDEVTVFSVTVNPTSVTGGSSATGTLTLNGAAPKGGVPVTLYSNSASAVVPPSLTVPAGAKTKTFTITTTGVASV